MLKDRLKRVSCWVCGKRFSSLSAMYRHAQVHNKEHQEA